MNKTEVKTNVVISNVSTALKAEAEARAREYLPAVIQLHVGPSEEASPHLQITAMYK